MFICAEMQVQASKKRPTVVVVVVVQLKMLEGLSKLYAILTATERFS